MKKKIRISAFTLVEVIVSMAVFAILMLGLMQFFSSAQGLWTSTSNQVQSYEEARSVMNMIADDLLCLYSEDRSTATSRDHRYFFIVQDPAHTFAPALNTHRFKGLAFATMRPARAHQDAITRLTEVFYRKRGNHLEMLELADNEQDAGRPWAVDTAASHFTRIDIAPFPFYRLVENVSGTHNNDNHIAPPSGNQAAWSVAANHVVRFSVKTYQRGQNILGFNVTGDPAVANSRMFDASGSANVTKLPDMVVIRLLTIDPQTAKEILLLDPDCIYEDHLETARNGYDSDDVLPEDSTDPTENRIRELLRKNMVIVTRAVTLNHGI
ncbi:MAG: prepilin-type N-terminal cleavage/methylation domain-containing protein [Lentisphaeria bacterium]|nr:prepilin-type N-terminal cleavage/methylation domain-containing protein [Lentisphaeria bacterium]